jgi:hypothetical protein
VTEAIAFDHHEQHNYNDSISRAMEERKDVKKSCLQGLK